MTKIMKYLKGKLNRKLFDFMSFLGIFISNEEIEKNFVKDVD